MSMRIQSIMLPWCNLYKIKQIISGSSIWVVKLHWVNLLSYWMCNQRRSAMTHAH